MDLVSRYVYYYTKFIKFWYTYCVQKLYIKLWYDLSLSLYLCLSIYLSLCVCPCVYVFLGVA